MPIPGDEEFRRLMREEMAQSSPEFMRGVACLSTGGYENPPSWFQRS